MKRSIAAVLLAVAVPLAGCAAPRPAPAPAPPSAPRVAADSDAAATSAAARAAPVPPAPGPLRTLDRPDDRLLLRPDLRHVVDLQEARDTAALVALLASRDGAVRARAAFALGSVQPTSAAPLLPLLRDEVAEVRADAAFAIGQSGDSTAGRRLLAAWSADIDPAVRGELLDALGKVGDRAALRSLDRSWVPVADRPAAAVAVARFGIRALTDSLGVARVAGWLRARDPALRLAAAYFFGRVRPASTWSWAADTVRAALDAYAPDEPAAMHLLLGLGRLGATADTPRLTRWLFDAADWRSRVNAARALGGRVGDPAARLALESVLDSALVAGGPEMHVGVQAASVLGASDSLDAVDLAVLRPWVRAHAEDWRVSGPLLSALARTGASGDVLDWLRRQDREPARLLAVRALGAARDPASLSALRRIAADTADAGAAAAAIAALDARRRAGALSDAGFFAAALVGLRASDVGLRVAAASALADSAFRALGAAAALTSTYATLTPPADLEAMQAVRSALRTLGAALPDSSRETATTMHDRVDWRTLTRVGAHPCFVLATDRGTMRIVLDAEEAPLTVATITALADAGRYDGVAFHRVVPNFVVQGGDFARGDGFGGPGFAIRSELTRIRYARGTLGMASAGKDTEGSQYFVTHSMQPHLDGAYTAFGRLVDGAATLDRLLQDDRVRAAEVLPTGAGCGTA